jgi:hypothetical protein
MIFAVKRYTAQDVSDGMPAFWIGCEIQQIELHRVSGKNVGVGERANNCNNWAVKRLGISFGD